jgi:hypothetical protein
MQVTAAISAILLAIVALAVLVLLRRFGPKSAPAPEAQPADDVRRLSRT